MSRGQGQRIQVPDELREVLLEFTISYLLEQPGDVISYAADYFSRLRENRTTSIIYEGTEGAGTTASSPDESTISREEGRQDNHVQTTYFLSLTFILIRSTAHVKSG